MIRVLLLVMLGGAVAGVAIEIKGWLSELREDRAERDGGQR